MRRRRNDDPSQVTSKRSLWLVMSALMTCLLLSALDQTIVSTALPTIVGDLGGLDHISWVVTAYLLSSTVSVPLFGKISDLYGRKPMLQITIVVFLVGSVCAGLAQNMLQLILARGLQGVGGGGILALTFTVLGDIMSPRERSRYTGFLTAVFASASVIGPLSAASSLTTSRGVGCSTSTCRSACCACSSSAATSSSPLRRSDGRSISSAPRCSRSG